MIQVKEEEELDEKQLTEEHKISDTDLETCSVSSCDL